MILKVGDKVKNLSNKEGKRGYVAVITSIDRDSDQINLGGKFEYYYESGEVRFLNEGFNFFNSEKELVKWIKESLCDNDVKKDEIRIYRVTEHYEAVMSLDVRKI